MGHFATWQAERRTFATNGRFKHRSTNEPTCTTLRKSNAPDSMLQAQCCYSTTCIQHQFRNYLFLHCAMVHGVLLHCRCIAVSCSRSTPHPCLHHQHARVLLPTTIQQTCHNILDSNTAVPSMLIAYVPSMMRLQTRPHAVVLRTSQASTTSSTAAGITATRATASTLHQIETLQQLLYMLLTSKVFYVHAIECNPCYSGESKVRARAGHRIRHSENFQPKQTCQREFC
jgi:hypothetical protein